MPSLRVNLVILAILVTAVLVATLYWIPKDAAFLPAILNKQPRCGEDALAVLVVHTDPSHSLHRQVIRTIWKRWSSLIVPVFFLGRASNPALQDRVDREQKEHHDIVQLDFADTYRNLTYKAMGWLKWVSQNCNRTTWVLKVDDDVFVDPFRMVRYLEGLRHAGQHLHLNYVCCIWDHMPILRDIHSKWYVTEEEFTGTEYPRYCSGWAYILPTRAVTSLLSAVPKVPFFWVDDVYATGTLAASAGIGHRNMIQLFSFSGNGYQEILQGQKMIAHLSGSEGPNEHMRLWTALLEREHAAPSKAGTVTA